jgi:hypothetical protein
MRRLILALIVATAACDSTSRILINEESIQLPVIRCTSALKDSCDGYGKVHVELLSKEDDESGPYEENTTAISFIANMYDSNDPVFNTEPSFFSVYHSGSYSTNTGSTEGAVQVKFFELPSEELLASELSFTVVGEIVISNDDFITFETGEKIPKQTISFRCEEVRRTEYACNDLF